MTNAAPTGPSLRATPRFAGQAKATPSGRGRLHDQCHSLGRGLDFRNVEAVDWLIERIETENGHPLALLLGIVESTPFQRHRRASDEARKPLPRNTARTNDKANAEKLWKTKDMDGNTLLHDAMIVYGSGNADGSRHNYFNPPVVLAGGDGGMLQRGRHVKHGSVPMTNMFYSKARRTGV